MAELVGSAESKEAWPEPLEPARDVASASWLHLRWDGVLNELAGEMAAQLSPIAAKPDALLDKVVEAARHGWPDALLGYWVAAARRAGCSWDQVGGSLGISADAATSALSLWGERFDGQVGATRDNLPVPLSSFIGRLSERVEVARLISGSRLLTLSGPPGVGKTRLAIEVGRSLAPTYVGGVWWVELAPLDPGEDVVPAVARALSAAEQPGRSIVEVVGSRVGAQRTVLVLDNCEHVRGRVAVFVNDLLRMCSGLSVLATSRQAIGVAGETVWGVPTLSLPGDGPPGSRRSDSVDLFCRRAAAVDPAFTPTPEVVGAVEEICRGLEGLPLAIELAASRMGVLSAQEIAGRLDDRLALLVGEGPGGVRPQTLSQAIDWSHDLLSAEERSLFRRLSVFAGGFNLEAIEAVCLPVQPGVPSTLELLSGLVAKSLVSATTSGPEARYRMLETIRAYAGERLAEAGEGDEIRERHVRWCVALAERAEPELYGPDQRSWLERLEFDYENLLTALSWLEKRGEIATGQGLAGAFAMFWRVHSRFAEGRRWLEVFLAAGTGFPATRAKAAWGAGFLTLMLEERQEALVLLQEALELYEAQADPQGCARCLMIMADAQSSPHMTVELAEQSVVLAREVDDTWCLVHAIVEAGRARVRMGEEACGMAMLEEAIAIARVSRSPDDLVFGLAVLGGVTLVTGDYQRSQLLLEEALSLHRAEGDSYGVAMSLVQLARLALRLGGWERARQLITEGIKLAAQCGNPVVIARAHCVMGRLAQVEEDLHLANAHFGQGLSAAASESMERVWAIEGIGEVAIATGDVAGARLHFEAVIAGPSNRATKPLVARAMDRMAGLARAECDHDEVASLHRRALVLRVESGDRAGIPDSVEALAAVAVKAGRLQHGARLLGAGAAIRESRGYARWPPDELAYQAQADALQARLGPPRFESARAAGADLSLDQAVEAALGVRNPERRAASGVAGLTPMELRAASLAAEGLTNPEIGERLFISRRTARAHLSGAFAKLGVSSRKELSGRLRSLGETPLT